MSDTNQLKFYDREGSADSFSYVGSMTVERGNVDYENMARSLGCRDEALCILERDTFAYIFKL